MEQFLSYPDQWRLLAPLGLAVVLWVSGQLVLPIWSAGLLVCLQRGAAGSSGSHLIE